MDKQKNIHPDLLQAIIPSGVKWKCEVDVEDINHLLDGNKFTHYQIADGKDLAEAMNFFKHEKFRPDKECKAIITIRIKESYNLTMRETDLIKSFIDEYLQSEDIRWGFGIDNNMPENIAITIAASYKYFYRNR